LTAQALFQQVGGHRAPSADRWPRSPRGFADALKRLAPALRLVGIDCRSLGKVGGTVVWSIAPSDANAR
jgi:hypothetical protein